MITDAIHFALKDAKTDAKMIPMNKFDSAVAALSMTSSKIRGL